MELDPLYCDTSLRRLAVATKLPAVHDDGRTFEEVAGERLALKEA